MYQKDITTDNYENWFTSTKIVLMQKVLFIYFQKIKLKQQKHLKSPHLIYPRTNERALAPADVPANIAEDF